MRPLAPISSIPAPRIRDAHLAYEPLAWSAWDVANPSVEIQATGINEHMARVDAALRLRLPAWRVRVRPAIKSAHLA